MRGLPICNSTLEVATVGFDTLHEHRFGVLITPWFMNLVLLPGDETWIDETAGSNWSLKLPSAPCDFTVCQDEVLGTFLSAVLFHSVLDFADQETAVAVAKEALKQLLQPLKAPLQAGNASGISRRQLLSGLGSS